MKPKTALRRHRHRLLARRDRPPTAKAVCPLPKRLACLLAAVLVAAGSATGAALGLGARAAAPMNDGNPFQNGDLVWQANKNTYRLAGVKIRVEGLTEIGAASPPYDYPGCLAEANRLFLEGAGGGNWPGWGVSDYAYTDVTVTNTRNLRFTALPTKGHCAQANNATSYFGGRDAYLNLEPDKSWWSEDGTVYHGVFFMAVDNGHASGVFDQSTFGNIYVYADWEVSGSIEIRKRSAQPSLTKGDSSFSLADARFSIYRDRDCTDRVATIATDEDGNARKDGLGAGTYWVKETKASKGYEKTAETVKAVVKAGETTKVGTDGDYWREKLRGGYVRIAKKSADDGLVALAPSRYSKAGAEYSIYTDAACTKAIGEKIVTDSSGNGESAELEAGTYYVKETKASPGYGLDTQTHGPFKVAAGVTASFTSNEPLLPGYLDLVKKSADPGITDGNSCYNLAGAEYCVYGDSACAGAVAAKLTTDAEGYAKSPAIPAGQYWVRETKPAEGYKIDAAIYGPYAIGGATTERVNGTYVTDGAVSDTAAMIAAKLDGETSQGEPLGGATLEGCEFTIRYYDGYYDSIEEAEGSGAPTRTWIVRTDEKGCAKLGDRWIVGGDELYRNAQGVPAIPLGTVLIQETKAPEGYMASDAVSLSKIVQGASGAEPHARYNPPSVPNLVKRGDLALDKYKHSDLSRLAGIPFRITALDTGESHIIVTDENGQAKTSSSWNAHSLKTNANDKAVAGDGTVDESALDAHAGIWFGRDSAGGTTKPLDDRGALPYGTYRVEELPVAKNHAMEMICFDFKVYKDAYEFHAELPNHLSSSPYIATSALDKDTYTKTAAADTATTVIDRVDYYSLDTNSSNRFTLKATLADADTSALVIDGSGSPVTAEHRFTATGATGYVQMEITFDSRSYAGGAIVVFEELYDDAGNLVCAHKDITDTAQTVRIAQPDISTVARDGADGDKLVTAEPSSMVIDAVACRGLKAGSSYTIIGSVNRVTGKGYEPLKDGDGHPVTAMQKFIADETDALVDVAFSLDATERHGDELVLFEELWLGDTLLATHADPLNKDQTVAVSSPTIATVAVDAADGDKAVSAEPGAAIADTVELGGLAAGSAYTVEGGLYLVSESGAEPLCDAAGKPIETACSFTADSPTRTLKLVFPLDAQALAGRSIVVFEFLRKDGVLLASHADASDDAQTVTVAPLEMDTSAADEADGDRTIAANRHGTIIDTVSYAGLAVGAEYSMEGFLNAIEPDGTATPLEDATGAPVAARTAFVPEKPAGEVEVLFEFDASRLAGRKLVVYEHLFRDGVELLRHDDPQDEDQTVEVAPLLLASHAENADGGGRSVSADSTAKVTDTIAYSGAEPGSPLTLHGIMVNPVETTPLLATSRNSESQAGEPEAAAIQKELIGFWTSYGRLAGIFGDGTRDNAPMGTGSDLLDGVWAGDAVLPLPYDAEAMEGLLAAQPAVAERLITAETTVIPEDSSGTATLEYAFDASDLQGQAGTSFVWAVDASGNIASVHADPGDAAQTVLIEVSEPGTTLPKTGDSGQPWAKLLAIVGAVALLTGVLAFRGLRREGRRQQRSGRS